MDIPEYLEHAVVQCREYVVVVCEKGLAQCKESRIKPAVQFFLALRVVVPATC